MAKIKGLVLAAGLSSRCGTNKLLVKVNGTTIIEKTIAILMSAPVAGISVVLGSSGDEIRKVLAGYPIDFIWNPDYESGMSSSLKTGISEIMQDHEAEAVLLMLGDMPLIKSTTVACLIDEYEKNSSLIIVPCYKGRRGHPVIFDRKMFKAISKITGDHGAREVITSHLDQVLFVDIDDPGIILDLDTKEAIEEQFRQYS